MQPTSWIVWHMQKKMAVVQIKKQRQKLHYFFHYRSNLCSCGKSIRSIKRSEKGIDISGEQTYSHSRKAEQKEFLSAAFPCTERQSAVAAPYK